MRPSVTRRLLAALLSLIIVLGIAVPAPARADSTFALTGSQLDVMESTYDFCVNVLELNTAAAVGIISNIYSECSFKTNVGDAGYGVCQWTGSRKTSLIEWAEANDYDYTTLEGQLYYMKSELENNKTYNKIFEKIKELPNTDQGAYDAAYIWCAEFERPASVIAKYTRGNNAKFMFWPIYCDRDTEEFYDDDFMLR